MSVGPRVLLSRGARFQLSRSALGLSTLRAPSNAGCASPRGTRSGASLCRSGNLASPCRRPQSSDSSFCGICSSLRGVCGMVRRVHRRRVFRRVRGPEVLRAFRQLRGVLRALTFSAFIAPAEHRRGGKNRLIFNRRARPNCMSIDYNLVQACDPALAHFTQKNAEKVYSNRLLPCGMPAARLSLCRKIAYNVTAVVTSERYQNGKKKD